MRRVMGRQHSLWARASCVVCRSHRPLEEVAPGVSLGRLWSLSLRTFPRATGVLVLESFTLLLTAACHHHGGHTVSPGHVTCGI